MGLSRYGATVLTLLQGCTAPDPSKESAPCLAPGVVAAVLEDASVATFLHSEMPGRDPLRVAGPGLARGVSMQAGHLRLVGVAGDDAAAPDVFRFTRCVRDVTGVAVEFHLPAEGMSGSATLRLKPDGAGWRIEAREVAER